MTAKDVSIKLGQLTSGNSVVEQARDALAAFVRNAPEGSKLPPERELAQRLGVSRTTLRDGVSRLSLLGLLEVKHGDGTYVRTPDASSLALPFRSLLENSESAPEELMALERGIAGRAADKLIAGTIKGRQFRMRFIDSE